MTAITHYLKAHVATVFAVGAWLTAALADGTITGDEWPGLLVALVGGGTVAAVRNRPKRRKPHNDAGGTPLGLVVGVFILIVAALTGLFLHPLWLLLIVLAVVVAFAV